MAPSAPAAEPAKAAAADDKAKKPRLIDLYDAWMTENPGPRSRRELIQLGIAKGWLQEQNAVASFLSPMRRARELFYNDPATDEWIRRAELKAPPTPGKNVRLPGGRGKSPA